MKIFHVDDNDSYGLYYSPSVAFWRNGSSLWFVDTERELAANKVIRGVILTPALWEHMHVDPWKTAGRFQKVYAQASLHASS